MEDAADDGPPEHCFEVDKAVYDDALMAQLHEPTFATLDIAG